jgi:hypothetical protein
MSTSRNARGFLERIGVRTTRRTQVPRIDLPHLRVQTLPLESDQLAPELLLDAQGDPPPDRGRLDEWPPPQEVK